MATSTPTPPPEEDPAPDPEGAKPSAGEELATKAQEAYKWWDNLATFHVDDPWWLGGLKLLVRAVGIIIMLILSPFIILGLFVAVMVAA
ncbi:MAG: hypothetical protein AAF840_06305 [Bacteroidota bacterium]